MTEKPKLVVNPEATGKRASYRCSFCNQLFLPPEDRRLKEAEQEVRAAFNEHTRDEHRMEAL